MRTLLSRGVRVPDDVALVGFDDIEDGQFATPSLSTVSPGKRHIAVTALDRITSRLENPTRAPGTLTIAPHQLIVRESSRS
jgi:DNA-binding LacI/PurR family transcriptional regulator